MQKQNLFDWVGGALNKYWDEVKWEYGREAESSVCTKIELLERYYANILSASAICKANRPKFELATVRWGYLYKYGSSHAGYVYQIASKSSRIESVFTENEYPLITCVGSGPGSEYLGLSKFIYQHGISCVPQFFLFDHRDEWSEVRQTLVEQLPVELKNTAPHFRRVDITDACSWTTWGPAFNMTDMFIFSWFLSEVFNQRAQVQPFLDYVFRSAKPNSLFLFIDLSHSQVYGWFDELARSYDLKIVAEGVSNTKVDDLGVLRSDGKIGLNWEDSKDRSLEFTKAMNLVNDAFTQKLNQNTGRCPKITSRIAYRVATK